MFSKAQILKEAKKARAAVEVDFARGAINVYVRIADLTRWDASAHRLELVAVEVMALKLRTAALLEDVHLERAGAFGSYPSPSACMGALGRYDAEQVEALELSCGESYEKALERVARVAVEVFGSKAVVVNWNHGKHGARVA